MSLLSFLNSNLIRNILICFTLGISVVLLMMFNLECSRRESDEDSVQIYIDTESAVPLRKELYGFNTNMMSGDYGYLDKDFIALTESLNPSSLRFPGGTVGNFYHWDISGFYEDEMNTTLSTQLNKRNRGNFNKLRKKRNGIISFDDFMKLCNDLSIKPIIMVNVWTGSPEKSAAWVRYAKEMGYNIRHWELGNEHYLHHYLNRFPTVQDYMETAKEHALAMRAVDPQIKLSVCASPIAFHKEGFLLATPQRKWDEGLAENTSGSSNWYDAFSVHVYAYKAVKDIEIEKMKAYLFGWIHFGIDEAMEYYEALFPNKEMWVTEWNIANPANRVANTQLHAMYVGDFFMKMLSIPKITHANFHVIAGYGKGFPVFSKVTPISQRTFWKYGGEPDSDYGDTIRRTVFYAFQLIGEVIGKAETLFDVSQENVPMFEGELDYKGKMMSGIQVRVLSNIDTYFIMVSNRMSRDISPIFYFDGKQLKRDATYRYVANDNLKATNGGNAEMEGSGEIEVKIEEWKGNMKAFIIPKNSFGILEVKK